jgi:hypothetical protein
MNPYIFLLGCGTRFGKLSGEAERLARTTACNAGSAPGPDHERRLSGITDAVNKARLMDFELIELGPLRPLHPLLNEGWSKAAE